MVLENGLSFPSSFILLALSGADDLGLEEKCQKTACTVDTQYLTYYLNTFYRTMLCSSDQHISSSQHVFKGTRYIR